MKATIQNQVIDYLQWSSQEYEDRIFLSMCKWCELHGQYPSVIQQLLANAAVNRWFLREYAKREANFLKMAETEPNNPSNLRTLYKVCTSTIQTVYCDALMAGIKRNRDFSNQLYNDAPVYYSN